MLYVGIDNGLKGGIAVIDCRELLVTRIVMPTVCPAAEAIGQNRVCVLALNSFLAEFCPAERVIVGLEAVKGAKSYRAAVSMADSYARIETSLLLAGYRFFPIPAASWQDQMLGKRSSGQTKAVALKAAQGFWPAEDWLPTTRHRTPHDGLVDAALIALYLKRNCVENSC